MDDMNNQTQAPASEDTMEKKRSEEYHGRESQLISWVNLYRICLAIFLTFSCCIFLFFVFFRFPVLQSIIGKFIGAASSILIGLLLAFILNPVKLFLEERIRSFLKKYELTDEGQTNKVSKAAAIAITTLFLLLCIFLLGVAVIPSVIRSITHLIKSMPTYANVLIDYVENGQLGESTLGKLAQNLITEGADYLENWFENTLLSQIQMYIAQITNGVISVLKGLLNFIIGIIVMDYVMAIQSTLAGQARKLLYATCKIEVANNVVAFSRRASDIFGGFITGKIIDSAIIGIICYVGCAILRIPDAVLVSVVIGVTNVIPFFGPFIGAVPSLFLVVVQSPIHALYLLIFIIVLQQVDGNIIGPKILGSSTGLSSFWVMVAILIGGGVFGIAGMIFGVPCMAMIYSIVQVLTERGLERKNLPSETRVYSDLGYVDEETRRIVPSDSTGNKRRENLQRNMKAGKKQATGLFKKLQESRIMQKIAQYLADLLIKIRESRFVEKISCGMKNLFNRLIERMKTSKTKNEKK